MPIELNFEERIVELDEFTCVVFTKEDEKEQKKLMGWQTIKKERNCSSNIMPVAMRETNWSKSYVNSNRDADKVK